MAERQSSQVPQRQVRAVFTAETMTVYQAFSRAIADAALRANRFVEPFSRSRMTWIKPSFLWLMDRSGWAGKPGQERILAIEITRSGFEWALEHSALSSFDPTVYPTYGAWRSRLAESCVRVQWDPERSIDLQPLPWRAIQVGLAGEAVERYVDEWTVQISDMTALAHRMRDCVLRGDLEGARSLLRPEAPIPMPSQALLRVGAE
jgi:hypothetical protein